MSNSGDTAPAVLVDDVTKSFRRPTERMHTLKERVLHPFHKAPVKELVALRDASFDVGQGEFFGIVGRNGSGKSTLLKCLAGIYRATNGTIRIKGRISTFIELGVGFNPDLAARDNVILNGIMLGLTRREAAARFDEVIEFAELQDFVDLKLKNYSSGMHVRLAFSVMTQVDADVLLIDEVLAVGDAAFQQKCYDVFHRLKANGKTIVFVTHDMAAVKQFCDRAMLLERGEIQIIGDPGEVGDQYLELNFGRLTGGGVADAEHVGDGSALIEEAWFEDETGERTGALRQGKKAHFCARIRFLKDVESPDAGVGFEDDDDVLLFASSLESEGFHSGDYRAGDEVLLKVAFDVFLRPGRIFATPWVKHRHGQNLMDRRTHIASAIVAGTTYTGGLLTLPHEIEFEEATRT